jgi:hypothetical protein
MSTPGAARRYAGQLLILLSVQWDRAFRWAGPAGPLWDTFAPDGAHLPTGAPGDGPAASPSPPSRRRRTDSARSTARPHSRRPDFPARKSAVARRPRLLSGRQQKSSRTMTEKLNNKPHMRFRRVAGSNRDVACIRSPPTTRGRVALGPPPQEDAIRLRLLPHLPSVTAHGSSTATAATDSSSPVLPRSQESSPALCIRLHSPNRRKRRSAHSGIASGPLEFH